jgi:hypothetical protein
VGCFWNAATAMFVGAADIDSRIEYLNLAGISFGGVQNADRVHRTNFPFVFL